MNRFCVKIRFPHILLDANCGLRDLGKDEHCDTRKSVLKLFSRREIIVLAKKGKRSEASCPGLQNVPECPQFPMLFLNMIIYLSYVKL